MSTENIIRFPEKIFEENEVVYPRMEADGKTYYISAANYAWDQVDFLREVVRPFYAGWVESEAACLQRRTQAEFVKMFQLYAGDRARGLMLVWSQPYFIDDHACGLMGFRDFAESLLCEQAAMEVGSNWRFIDYYRLHKQRTGDGLGCLNSALEAYAIGYVPDLLPDSFPAPIPR
jgi:hypothetical protein